MRTIYTGGVSAGRLAALVMVLAASSGCVTVYQPLTALQRPVAVDPALPNFEKTRILVRCLPSEALPESEAQILCRKLSSLFRNQGAEVDQEVPRAGRGTPREEGAPPPELIVDVTTRKTHEDTRPVLRIPWLITGTLIPHIQEQSFAQDVTIRDGSGSTLATDTVEARFIEYNGLVVWGVNQIADAFIRSDAEDVTGDAPNKLYSRDFYGQVSQLAFNAKVRARVLRNFEPAPAPPAKSGAE